MMAMEASRTAPATWGRRVMKGRGCQLWSSVDRQHGPTGCEGAACEAATADGDGGLTQGAHHLGRHKKGTVPGVAVNRERASSWRRLPAARGRRTGWRSQGARHVGTGTRSHQGYTEATIRSGDLKGRITKSRQALRTPTPCLTCARVPGSSVDGGAGGRAWRRNRLHPSYTEKYAMLPGTWRGGRVGGGQAARLLLQFHSSINHHRHRHHHSPNEVTGLLV